MKEVILCSVGLFLFVSVFVSIPAIKSWWQHKTRKNLWPKG